MLGLQIRFRVELIRPTVGKFTNNFEQTHIARSMIVQAKQKNSAGVELDTTLGSGLSDSLDEGRLDQTDGYSFSTSNEQDDKESQETRFKHSRSAINVSKKMLARYVIMNRCLCIFMIWLHISVGIVSTYASDGYSQVTSESTVCRYVFYLSHYLYGTLNFLAVGIYIYLMTQSSITGFDVLRKSDWLSIIFLLVSSYTLFLKLLSNWNCVFWRLTITQIIFQAAQFIGEGVAIKLFYQWVYEKTELMKETLETNLEFVTAARRPKV